MVRTSSYCEKSGLKKGIWAPEEDSKLKAYVSSHGCRNWRRLPKFAGLSRCGKSCRLRWMNYLRPDIKRGNFTEEEDNIIISLHESLGNRWSQIAAVLPGRTDNEIKNHWHTNLKKKTKQVVKIPPSKPVEQKETQNSKGETCDPKPILTQNHKVLESTPRSPQPSSSKVSDLAIFNSTNVTMGQDGITSANFSGANFWTEPPVTDTNDAYNVTSANFVAPKLDDDMILSPHSPVSSAEVFFPFLSYEEDCDGLDWLTNLMEGEHLDN